METIKHDQLKILAANNGVKGVTIAGTTGGFFLNITTFNGDMLLHTKTGEARLFKKADALLGYLKDELGIGKATVQFDRWNPAQQALKALT